MLGEDSHHLHFLQSFPQRGRAQGGAGSLGGSSPWVPEQGCFHLRASELGELFWDSDSATEKWSVFYLIVLLFSGRNVSLKPVIDSLRALFDHINKVLQLDTVIL